jgi:hypothetical protein
MTENVARFFARYDAEPALRARVAEAEAAYPGSLEVRESVVTAVLLPIAAELGLPFTLQELRAFETKKMLSRIKPDVPIEEGEEDEDEDFEGYWLLERGWDYDTEALKKTLR